MISATQAKETKNSIFGNHPPERIYFQVILVEPNSNERQLVPPSRTFPEALIEADRIAKEFVDQNEDSKVLEVEESEINDDFHIYVLNNEEKEIARIGLMIMDVRGETMH